MSPPQHPVSTLRAVARSGGGGCCCHRQPWLSVPFIVGNRLPPSPLLVPSSFYLHPRPTLQAVACRHGGECCTTCRRCGGGEACLLAPGPPCERVLTVAGDGCWGLSPSPRTLVCAVQCRCCRSTCDLPHEQLLGRLGRVVGLLGHRRLVAPAIHPTSSCS
jgi:hypothetical protein